MSLAEPTTYFNSQSQVMHICTVYTSVNLVIIGSYHTMDMLWENSTSLNKTISFQSKVSVVCSVTTAVSIDFYQKKLNVFPNMLFKNKWISEFHRTNPQKLRCWSSFCVNYFLRYYLIMQHQPTAKRVNGAHEWAHRPYQLLSAPYHCCKHRWQDERQLAGAHLYFDIAKSGYLFHGFSGGMWWLIDFSVPLSKPFDACLFLIEPLWTKRLKPTTTLVSLMKSSNIQMIESN